MTTLFVEEASVDLVHIRPSGQQSMETVLVSLVDGAGSRTDVLQVLQVL